MKKKGSLLVLPLMVLSLVGCGGKTEELTGVAKVIKDAEALHFDELVEQAKTEVGDGEVKVFGNSSSIQTACENFTAAYGIKFSYEKVGDADLYSKLSTTIPSDTYTADFVFAQDGNSMMTTMLTPGYLLNYTPLDYKDVLAADDLTPATGGIAFNKVFMYNNTDFDGTNAETAKTGAHTNYVTNVWQFAGTEADAGHISGLSFKDPSQENINMNMLIMLTSDAWVAKLTAAYKDYYGKDYVAEAGYESIAYKFIDEFMKNVVFHESDGTECRALAKGVGGKAAYVNFNKLKDCKGEGIGAEDDANLTTAALETTVKGFAGFVYKMYPLIPRNAKYPLAACAFENYILSTEGYSAAWKNSKGYYTVNPSATVPEGDRALSWWKDCCVVEDPAYVAENYADVSEYITTRRG